MNPLLILPLIIPLITTLVILLGGFDGKKTGAVIGIIGAFALLIADIFLLQDVLQNGIQVVSLGGWAAPFGIALVADNLSAIMVAITGVVGVAVSIYALHLEEEQSKLGTFPLFQVLLMGVSGAFLAGDIFNLYVWFEIMLIASFVLLAKGGSKIEMVASVKYVVMNLVSSAIFLTGIGLLYGKVGTLNMADIALKLSQQDDASWILSTAAFFLTAFGIKAALFPMYFWLPASYHAPPMAIAAVFSGLLTKVGVYALMRVFTLIFTQDPYFTNTVLLILAGLTMVSGVLGAIAQNDVRRILSFHIISQIGYMIMGLALMTPLALAGAVFYLIHHIVVKTNLFLIAGIIAHHGDNTFDLKKLGGLYRHRPMLAILFLIPAMSLAGFPPLSGFFSKFILVRAGIEQESWLIVVTALAVGVLTLVSMSKIWNQAFWQPRKAEQGEGKTPFVMILPVAVLATMTVAIGFGIGPLFEISKATAEQLLNPSLYIEAVLGKGLE
jgi:multicomponent Na+:H+ antiporter subunit D